MDLRQYRTEFGVTFRHVAKGAGTTLDTISAIARGKRRPSWHMAGRIEAAIGGLVPRSNWFPDLPAAIAAASQSPVPPGAVVVGEAAAPHSDPYPPIDRAAPPTAPNGGLNPVVTSNAADHPADHRADQGGHAGATVEREPGTAPGATAGGVA
jgi:DNA-binding XRE family transcriptional regulator